MFNTCLHFRSIWCLGTVYILTGLSGEIYDVTLEPTRKTENEINKSPSSNQSPSSTDKSDTQITVDRTTKLGGSTTSTPTTTTKKKVTKEKKSYDQENLNQEK